MSLDITPMVPAGRQLIHGYGNGGFRIGEEAYSGAVLVLIESTVSWDVAAVSDISLENLAPVIDEDLGTEILLIGCGAGAQPIGRPIRDGLKDAGIVAELMDTGAACRTFNVLLAEERRVAAALIPVD